MRPSIVIPILFVAALAGCRGGPTPVAPIDEARRAAIVAEQARRIGLLTRIDRAGTGTLRTRDATGKAHEDQGQIRMLLAAPSSAAIRLVVVSETLAWLGCDAEHAWVFDLHDRDDRWCVVGPHAELAADVGVALPPSAIFDMLGLVALPDDPAAWSSDDAGRPVAVAAGTAGPLSVTLDAAGLPWRVVASDARGRPLLESELTEYASIEMAGVPVGGLPKFPGRATIRRADGDLELRLSFDTWKPVVLPEARWQAAFDFDTLLVQLRPDRVDDRRQDRPPAAPGDAK